MFGSISKRKKRCLVWIGGIQRVLADRESSYLQNMESTLIQEYKDILEQERIFLDAKSKGEVDRGWGTKY